MNAAPDTVTDVLVRARERMKERGWRSFGRPLVPGQQGICLMMAIGEVTPEFSHNPFREAALARLKAAAGTGADNISLIIWNDDPDRTEAEVLAAFERAINGMSIQ